MTRADYYMEQMIKQILDCGTWDENPRPHYADGTPAHTLFVNHTFRTYDLSKGDFPICTLRPQAWKTGIKEIFTIYQEPTNNIAEMCERGVTWWGDWDIGDGTIGQRYGATVKRYDLINRLIEDIKSDPYGRRKIVSLWQETDLRETPGLAPCAFQTIWNVRGEYLDMLLVQRSGDMLTASGPGGINEIQYAALLMMIARHTGYKPGKFSHIVANE
jgi:thymidylate synthase